MELSAGAIRSRNDAFMGEMDEVDEVDSFNARIQLKF